MDPSNVLKRGYSLTLINGKALKSYEQVKESDLIETLLADGSVTSKVQSVKKSADL
jgi:exodeoxyribonuclease VII large subunit